MIYEIKSAIILQKNLMFNPSTIKYFGNENEILR